MFAWLYPTIAQAAGGSISIKLLVYRVSYYILNPLIKAGFVVAFVYFMWGVAEYISERSTGRIWDSSAFDSKAKAVKPSDKIIYGLFGLFIMVSAIGILRFIHDAVGSTIQVP